jgi:molecular chaperone GrpE
MSTKDGSAAMPDEDAVVPVDGAAVLDDGDGDEVTAADTDALAQAEDRWRRAVADLENFRKRCARQVAGERDAERARVTGELLPVIDNLDRALEHAAAGSDPFVDGVRAVREQALGMLEKLGYRRVAETGVPFDPFRHEAVALADDTDAPAGTVVSVLRPGYGEGDHQLRPAAVVVAGKRG